MRVDFLLGRLSRVKARGSDQWMACCPAHEDRTASLSIKSMEDGRVLLHCFAGCTADDILGSVGLEFGDLFPERIGHYIPPTRNRIPPGDLLRIVERELMVVAVVASDIESGKSVAPEDWARFSEAAAILIQARASLDE